MASSAPQPETRGERAAVSDPALPEAALELLLCVGEAVLAAAALEPGEREVYLGRLASDEPALAAEVHRRLALAAVLPESFLSVPAGRLLTAGGRLWPEAALGPEADPGPEDDPDEPLALVSGEDRYQVLEGVGEGGMATVHRAFDRQLARPVALKFLDRLEGSARQRFLAEAQSQARVRHENVLEVYETGELAGRPFIAMRWVDGPTLLSIRDQTSLEQKLRLVSQVAEGLHAAHREGLIHRDVKPSNILVEKTADGDYRPWVADFGIAQRVSEADRRTGGFIAGTPAYLTLELLDPAGPPADRRADVYGLGVALYELLTGELPFRSADFREVLRQARERRPRSPRELLPSLPAEVEAIVLKCLEKDPEHRYPSARALAEDLRRFLDGELVEAHTATLAYRLTRFALRHRVLLAVGGVACVLLAAALLVAALLGVEASAEKDRHREARLDARAAVAELAAVHRDEPGDIESLRWLTEALLLLGRVESRHGATEAAAGAWRQAESLLATVPPEPGRIQILANRALLLLATGRRREAQPLLELLASRGYRQPDFVARCREHGVDLAALG